MFNIYKEGTQREILSIAKNILDKDEFSLKNVLTLEGCNDYLIRLYLYVMDTDKSKSEELEDIVENRFMEEARITSTLIVNKIEEWRNSCEQ